MELTVFHSRGACSLAPLVALEEAGLPYTPHFVDLKGDRSELIAVNPSGRVPALVIDGEVLTENVAILYRIASLAPAAKLLPATPDLISQQLSALAWMSSTLHIARRQVAMPVRFTADAAAQARLAEDGRPKLWSLLQTLAAMLDHQPWFGGAAFGLADAYALVFVNWGLGDGFPMYDLPEIVRWKDAMLARPAVRRALALDAGPLAAEALAL